MFVDTNEFCFIETIPQIVNSFYMHKIMFIMQASNPYGNTTPSPVFTGDTEYFKKLDFSDF